MGGRCDIHVVVTLGHNLCPSASLKFLDVLSENAGKGEGSENKNLKKEEWKNNFFFPSWVLCTFLLLLFSELKEVT